MLSAPQIRYKRNTAGFRKTCDLCRKLHQVGLLMFKAVFWKSLSDIILMKLFGYATSYFVRLSIEYLCLDENVIANNELVILDTVCESTTFLSVEEKHLSDWRSYNMVGDVLICTLYNDSGFHNLIQRILKTIVKFLPNLNGNELVPQSELLRLGKHISIMIEMIKLHCFKCKMALKIPTKLSRLSITRLRKLNDDLFEEVV
jgi:hypothetical protein